MKTFNPAYEKENDFVRTMRDLLLQGDKFSRPQTEKLAGSFSVTDRTKIKELTEMAIVEAARHIASMPGLEENKYKRIVDLYYRQSNLSFRTSKSILLNQYSTPAPIGYLMGLYCGIQMGSTRYFEPSAGNGLLTIAASPRMGIVNEIDDIRNENLHRGNYAGILQQDATLPFRDYYRYFDAVLTNPPFGYIKREVYVADTYRIYALDHHMVINALECMKDGGKCAFIVGNHFAYDEKGRIKSGKNRIFLNYLYRFYNVDDIISIDGKKLYSRMGTAFDVSVILINGRKKHPQGNAPLKRDMDTEPIRNFDDLYHRFMANMNKPQKPSLEARAKALLKHFQGDNSLDGPYQPSSKATSLQTQVPDSMDFEIHQALKRITKEVSGDMDNFVRERLGYPSKQSLFNALSAEQIDAVGLSIYNIEALSQSMIIGDQTGIGKGRVAASIIRYATQQGLKPIFITEKANLFSDIYRDLAAIGSGYLKPFIVNNRESKTDIKDEDGLVIYHAPSSIEQHRIFTTRDLSGYDFVVATYSQFNNSVKGSPKPEFLLEIAQDTIIILDESHNASGMSNTGLYMQSVMRRVKGAVFLSATFAKRPDNMPIYAMKSCISEASLSSTGLIEAVSSGGVALQEILSSQLVAEGQMIRRERTYEGIEVNYMVLDEYAQEHRAVADNITSILRDIISFQAMYVDKRVEEMDEIAKEEGMEVQTTKGTKHAGVDNQPYFSKIFNVINQMLFAIKAKQVALHAIEHLKEGRKPVIAFASTMGSFLEELAEESDPFAEGQVIKTDFAIVLEKGLEGVLRYTVTDPDGMTHKLKFDFKELGNEARREYERIQNKIKNSSSGICISPIDVLVQTIQDAGFSVGEVTGRSLCIDLNDDFSRGTIRPRKKINTNDAFRRFNNNELDVLLINQSGSTGASAHAIVTNKVPREQVKQRVMIVLQPELDINIEVQKRGRINRTGQILKPRYDYQSSVIPAEMRLMMMLQKKLKSLDANTSSNQKQSESLLNVPDFLNKYGDEIVYDYLTENPDINDMLGDPLKIGKEGENSENAALRVSGRVAVLSVQMQEDFYNEIKDRYETHVNYLKQTGEYDLEVEEMDLKAETVLRTVVKIGKGGVTNFGEDTYIEQVNANVLKKPYRAVEVKNMVDQSLNGKSPQEYQQKILTEYNKFKEIHEGMQLELIEKKFAHLIQDIPNDKKLKKANVEDAQGYLQAMEDRKAELLSAKEKALSLERNKQRSIARYIDEVFRTFKPGERLAMDFANLDGTSTKILTVFIGYKIDEKRNKNPYAPSSIGLRFAVASSHRYLELHAGMSKEINAIIGASRNVRDEGLDNTLVDWEYELLNKVKDRTTRYIITGNILQAFREFPGKLISYSTLQKEVKKGILLPESWDFEKKIGQNISVPIYKALKLVKSLVTDHDLMTNNGVTIIRRSDGDYQLIVGASLKQGGEVYLNADLLKLVNENMFQQSGKNMTAILPYQHIDKAMEIFQEQMGDSISIPKEAVERIGLIETKLRKSNSIRLPQNEDEDKLKRRRRREIEARALALLFQFPDNSQNKSA